VLELGGLNIVSHSLINTEKRENMAEREEISKEELIRALLASRSRREGEPTAELIKKLKNLHFEYASNANRFKPGDLVVWKDGMRNKKTPQNRTPAIVIEHLATPIISNTDNAGSAYYREPLDLLAGFIDEDGDFVIYHFDSRRFKHFEGA
jgi:hypothetical protein